MISFEENLGLLVLEDAGVITTSEKNLRSKISSISRSLKNLEEKRRRIDFEIKKQKKSLVRKREELKRASKRLQTKPSLYQEDGEEKSIDLTQEIKDLQRLDLILLQESNQMLEI